MAQDDNKQGFVTSGSIKKSETREDTPSFIRNVEARAELLNPQSEGRIPVLSMPTSVKRWRQVRWPLFI